MENKAGYSQRNAFVPVPTVASFDQFNEWLWEWCEKNAQRLQPVGRFRRSYGREEELYDWTQYVGTLLKNPAL